SVLAGVVIVAVPGFQERITSQVGRFETRTPERWFSSRVGLAEGGVRVMLDSPLFGVGPGHNKYFIPKLLPDWEYDKHAAHDTYLELGADLGVFGLAAFLWLLIGAIRGLGGMMRAAEAGVAGALTFDPRPVRAVYCT